jgi:hypothetical protein
MSEIFGQFENSKRVWEFSRIDYARKSLAETGVADSSIQKIIEAAQELTLRKSITKRHNVIVI